MGNMGRGNILTSKLEYVPESFPIDEQHRLRSGDVLFNTRNTLELVGKVCVWRDELPVAYYNSNVLRLEFSKQQISSSYFENYALNSHRSVLGLREIATGTTSVAAIYTQDLLGFKVATPTLREQTAIAAALSDADALIASLDALIAKKRDPKGDLFVSF
jgi:type I restriction enzyme S subunit